MSSAPKIKSRRARRPDLRYVAAVGRGYIPAALLRGGRDVVGAEDQELFGPWPGWRAAADPDPSGASDRPTSVGPAPAVGRGYPSDGLSVRGGAGATAESQKQRAGRPD